MDLRLGRSRPAPSISVRIDCNDGDDPVFDYMPRAAGLGIASLSCPSTSPASASAIWIVRSAARWLSVRLERVRRARADSTDCLCIPISGRARLRVALPASFETPAPAGQARRSTTSGNRPDRSYGDVSITPAGGSCLIACPRA